LCNNLPSVPIVGTASAEPGPENNRVGISGHRERSEFRIKVYRADAPDLQSLSAWLTNNNVHAVYQLATPEYIPVNLTIKADKGDTVFINTTKTLDFAYDIQLNTRAQIDSVQELVSGHKHNEYLPLSGGSMTGSIIVAGQYVSDVSNGERHFGFYDGNNLVSYMFGRADGTIGMWDQINKKPIYYYDIFSNKFCIESSIYSNPFNMFVEDNGYTSRLKANRGNFRLVDAYDIAILSWSHDYLQIGPDATNQINLGSADFRFKSLYLNAQPNVSSDRTLKENIKYVNSNESNVSYEDMYAFVKDDLELATYNLVEHDKLNMGFIAQDLLVNLDGTDNKVGQMIVNPVPVPTEEEIAEGKPYPTLSYDMGMYTSVLAGALKEAINKIEQLEARIQELENK
jgi:hypothetical protein